MIQKLISIVAFSVCGLFLITSCTTVNPYTQESQVSKVAIGAGIGAVTGAAVGYLTAGSKKKRKNALIGAGLGAVAGGGVGYYMDVQEAKLRQKLEGSGVSVTRQGNNIMLNMPGNITFASASSDINMNFYNVLDSVSIVVKEYKKTYVDVVGHTDSVGAASYNDTLSKNRASSVARYLVSRGLLGERFLIAGRGENEPIASNKTNAGRTQNRRVTIQLTPITQ